MSGEIRIPEALNEDGEVVIKHIVGGFATCGTHSLVKYLKEVKKLEDVTLMEGFFHRTGCSIYKRGKYKIWFITRKDNRLGITDFDKYTSQYPECDIEVISLEEIMKDPEFPHENKSE